jgi:SPP1 family predicted phage head-tail adaptor
MPDVLSIADTTVAAGAFNRRITIQELNTSATDGQGGATPAYTDVISTWAHIEPWVGRGGAEIYFAQQMYPHQLLQILIRYRPSMNIVAGMFVLFGTHRYRIRSATVPAQAFTTIQLVCEELQASGSEHNVA